MSSSNETIDQRERRELTSLLWFFWVGIWVAVAGALSRPRAGRLQKK